MKSDFGIFWLSSAIVICFVFPLYACNTPVFQYALLRWIPDTYRIFIFYEHDFTRQQQQALDMLDRLEQRSLILHKCVKIHDIRKADNITEKLRKFVENTDVPLPLLVVQYPSSSGLDKIIYADTLSASAVRKISSSPIRRKIANILLRGDTIVWLILLSNDANLNKRVGKLLSTELRKYASKYQQENLSEIKFEIIKIHRNDSEEKFLVNLLTKLKSNFRSEENKLIAYPIFGKGRILFPISEEKLTAEAISVACDFMTGPCACEIKEQNPGVDLLIDIDWDNSVSASGELIEQMLPSPENLKTASFHDRIKSEEKDVTPLDDKIGKTSKNIAIYITIAAIFIGFGIVSFIIYRLRK